MLAGRRLFVRDDGASVMVDKLLRGTIEAPSTHARDVPKLLDAITLHGLARNAEQRFATAREMALAIEKFGELARPSEIGEWVEAHAAESLAERKVRLKELETTSSTYQVGRSPSGGMPAALQPASEPLFEVQIDDDLGPEEPSFPRRLLGRMSAAIGRDGIVRSMSGRSGRHRKIGSTSSSLSSPHAVTISPAHTAAGKAGESSARPPRPMLVFGAYALLGAAIMVAALTFRAGGHADADRAGATHLARGAGVAGAIVPPAPMPACRPGMVRLPGGQFFMGKDDGRPMERPSHTVTLSPFCIDIHEVTAEDYKACSDRGDCKPAGTTDNRVGIVDREMATTYCKARAKRLPTEAEWEFAAQGSDGRMAPASRFGLEDVTGNTREWVSDDEDGRPKANAGTGFRCAVSL
jgi:formylglycine-generating enzyme required for sulfatase activity